MKKIDALLRFSRFSMKGTCIDESRRIGPTWTVICMLAVVLIPGKAAELDSQMGAVLRFTGIDNPSPGDVVQMTELWTKAQSPGLSTADRRAAFRAMYVLYYRLHGRKVADRGPALDFLSQTVTTAFERGARMNLSLPEPRGTPSGNYLHLETRGSGRVPLLLISDLGVDGRQLYASFSERQGKAYRMHFATLPYSGDARPLPWPERIDIAARPWLTQIEQELVALIDRPQMDGVTIIGTQAGGYFATRLALLRPKRVNALILVNALVHTQMRSNTDPDAPATITDRLTLLKAVTPGPQLFPVAPTPQGDELKKLIADPASTHPSARNWMAFSVKSLDVSRAWSLAALSGGFFISSQVYGWELASTDLTEDLRNLAVRTLVMASWHDEASPANSTAMSQWEQIRLLYPSIPLSIVTFADTRSYVSADAPQAFDTTLAAFLSQGSINGGIGFSSSRASPRASVHQTLGAGTIDINYGRPRFPEGKVWGGSVPFGRVWRAGANEATQFVFSRDVRIEGQTVPAGTYTFFAIPRETKWTVIINRVLQQWGAIDYNAAFDALRFDVGPSEVPNQDRLRYTIEPGTTNDAIVTLAWGKLAISFRIEMVG